MFLNTLFSIPRKSSAFSGDSSGTNSSLVVLNCMILSFRPVVDLIFAALVAITFFAIIAANSTHARIRPITFILRPVYHHPDSSTLTVFFLLTDLFRSVSSWTSRAGLYEIRVIRTRTANCVNPSYDHQAVWTRKRIARSLRIDFLRTSFGFFGADFRSALENVKKSTCIVVSEGVLLTSLIFFIIKLHFTITPADLQLLGNVQNSAIINCWCKIYLEFINSSILFLSNNKQYYIIFW